MKNIKLQYRVIDLLNHLPSEKQREILENINIELFKPRIQERLKLYKNNLRFKKESVDRWIKSSEQENYSLNLRRKTI